MTEAEAFHNPAIPTAPEAPQPVYNCPECSHYLQPGTLACPDCHAIVYAAWMRDLAIRATAQEEAADWTAARDTWQQALPWLPPDTQQFDAVEQRIAAIDARLRGVEETRAKWTRRLGPLAPVVFFLAKAKTLIFFLFKAKFLLSIIPFFLLYWGLFGWKFALGFTVSIFIHEMGHYVTAKRRGLKVDLPVFLPGLGAYVRWYSQGVSLDDLSSIALAGPFFGLIFGVLSGVLAVVFKEPLFSALAHVAAWLNVLNLIPVFGLDGAQATYALNRTQRWLVLATALVFFGMLHEGVFVFVAVGMGWRIWQGGDAEVPHTKTLVKFVLLLFALGVLMAVFPDSRRFGRY